MGRKARRVNVGGEPECPDSTLVFLGGVAYLPAAIVVPAYSEQTGGREAQEAVSGDDHVIVERQVQQPPGFR
jgi:hypothetical protein